MGEQATAIVAGGCFWCTEAVFRDVNLLISEQYKHTRAGDGKKPSEETTLRKFQVELTLNNDADVDANPVTNTQTTAVEVKEQ